MVSECACVRRVCSRLEAAASVPRAAASRVRGQGLRVAGSHPQRDAVPQGEGIRGTAGPRGRRFRIQRRPGGNRPGAARTGGPCARGRPQAARARPRPRALD